MTPGSATAEFKPNIFGKGCPHLCSRRDRNGDVVITYCNHIKNPDDHEGNCNAKNCPLESGDIIPPPAEFKPLELEDITEEQKLFQDKDQTTNIIYLARDLKLMKEHAQALEDQAKELRAEIAQKEQVLYDLMIEQGVGKLNVDGKTLSPCLQYWASIPDNLKEAGFAQLEALGMASHIKQTVNSQTLSAEIREMIDRGELVEDKEMGIWRFKGSHLNNMVAAMKISGKKKINMRKG